MCDIYYFVMKYMYLKLKKLITERIVNYEMSNINFYYSARNNCVRMIIE